MLYQCTKLSDQCLGLQADFSGELLGESPPRQKKKGEYLDKVLSKHIVNTVCLQAARGVVQKHPQRSD